MSTMGKTANNNAWLLTIGKSNDTTYDGSAAAYVLSTSGTFADKNIAVNVPAGSISRSGNTVTYTAGWISTGGTSTGDTTTRTAVAGALNAISGVTLSTYLTTTSADGVGGFYGNGVVSTGTGWVTSGSTTSNSSSTYYIKKGAATLAATVTATSSTPSGTLTEIDQKYFTVTPTKSAFTAGWLASLSDGTTKGYRIKTGSATVSGTGASSTTSLSGTTLTVSRSVTPTVTAGWIDSGTAGTITTTGTVPTETRTFTVNGTYTPSTGKLISEVTVNVSTTSGAAGSVKINYAGPSQDIAKGYEFHGDGNVPVRLSTDQATYLYDFPFAAGGTYTVDIINVQARTSGAYDSRVTVYAVPSDSESSASGWTQLGSASAVSGHTTSTTTSLASNKTFNKIAISMGSSGGVWPEWQYIKVYTANSSTYIPALATAEGTIQDITSFKYAYLKKGSATVSGTVNNSDVVWDNGTIRLTNGIAPTITSGWINSGTGTEGEVTLTGALAAATTGTSNSGTLVSTVTPGTSNKYVNTTLGYTTAKYWTIAGDANLVAANIANGVTIFGVTGTHSGGITPTGNIQLTAQSGTDVTNYATASVRSAATFSMTGSAVTDVVTVDSLSSGYYPIKAKVKGTVAASTAGWFSSSGAVQASSATQVGKMAAATFTVTSNSVVSTAAGYVPADTEVGAVAPGTAGTPTASKGTASSYSINVTPSVTNTTGYITGGTKTGTAVSVSPTDLGLTLKTALSKSGGTVSLAAGSYNTSALSATVSRSDLGITDKAAATYNPSTSVQTINSGYYLTGAQTIAATKAITDSTYTGYITSSTTARTTTLKTITGPTTSDIYIYPSTSIYNYWANTVGIKVSKPAAMTLPSSTSNTSSGTSKATISYGANHYLNIPTGYNSTAQYYTLGASADLTQGDYFYINNYDQAGTQIFAIDHEGQEIDIIPTLECETLVVTNYNESVYVNIIGDGELTNVVKEISTLNGMDSVLTSANSGIYFRYTGTTGTSSGGNIYIKNNLYKYE